MRLTHRLLAAATMATGVVVVLASPSAVTAQPVGLRVDPVPTFDVIADPLPSGRAAGGRGAAPARGAIITNLKPRIVRLADGRIVVAVNGALRIFDATGRLVQTIEAAAIGPSIELVTSGLDSTGRRLQVRPGPGRVGGLLFPYRGDSLLVAAGLGNGGISVRSASAHPVEYMDYTVAGGIVLDSAGRHGRALLIEASVITPPRATHGAGSINTGLQGVLDDGSFIMGGPVADGVPSARITYYRVSPDGSRRDTIVTVPLSGHPMNYYQRTPLAAARGQAMYWTDGSRFEVTVFDLSPRAPGAPVPTRVLRSSRAPEPITDSIISIGKTRLPGAALNPPGGTPSHLSAVAGILVDERGSVWLEHYRATMPFVALPPDPSDVPRYTVFDPAGREIGEVLMPRGFRAQVVGADYVLGMIHDANGVEHVRVHRLVR